MTLKKLIDSLTKIQNSTKPESQGLKTEIKKIDISFYNDIVITLGDKPVSRECINCDHFDYCGKGKPVVCELFSSKLKLGET